MAQTVGLWDCGCHFYFKAMTFACTSQMYLGFSIVFVGLGQFCIGSRPLVPSGLGGTLWVSQ